MSIPDALLFIGGAAPINSASARTTFQLNVPDESMQLDCVVKSSGQERDCCSKNLLILQHADGDKVRLLLKRDIIYMRVEQKVLSRGLHCEGPGVCKY